LEKLEETLLLPSSLPEDLKKNKKFIIWFVSKDLKSISPPYPPLPHTLFQMSLYFLKNQKYRRE
jgi:hypothetical protein